MVVAVATPPSISHARGGGIGPAQPQRPRSTGTGNCSSSYIPEGVPYETRPVQIGRRVDEEPPTLPTCPFRVSFDDVPVGVGPQQPFR